MKKLLFWVLSCMIGSVCHAEDITIRYNGAKAEVQQKAKDSVNVIVDGANVNVESLYKDHKLTIRLTGKSDNGQLILKAAGKAKVELDGLTLTSQEGAPLDLKNKKKVEVVATKGTNNTLTIPFSLRRSASLISSPAFKVGNTYTVKTKGYEKTFILNEPFTAVR